MRGPSRSRRWEVPGYGHLAQEPRPSPMSARPAKKPMSNTARHSIRRPSLSAPLQDTRVCDMKGALWRPSFVGANPPSNIFPAPSRSSIFIMPANTCGIWLASSIPTTYAPRSGGWAYTRNAGSIKAKSKSSSSLYGLSTPPAPKYRKSCAPKPTTLKPMPSACAIPSSASNTCLLVPASSKPVANPSSVRASNNPACSGRSTALTPILALRCCHLNGRFENHWEGRRAA